MQSHLYSTPGTRHGMAYTHVCMIQRRQGMIQWNLRNTARKKVSCNHTSEIPQKHDVMQSHLYSKRKVCIWYTLQSHLYNTRDTCYHTIKSSHQQKRQGILHIIIVPQRRLYHRIASLCHRGDDNTHSKPYCNGIQFVGRKALYMNYAFLYVRRLSFKNGSKNNCEYLRSIDPLKSFYDV